MKVSFDKLEDAMTISSDEISHWVDKKTGNVIFISSEFLDDEDYFADEAELEAAREILMMCGEIERDENIEIDENRYLEVVQPHSGEKWKWMEEFALSQQHNSQLFDKLADALRGKKPFRKFKDVLIYQSEAEQKWFEFEAQKLREFIKDWAESKNIEIDFSN